MQFRFRCYRAPGLPAATLPRVWSVTLMIQGGGRVRIGHAKVSLACLTMRRRVVAIFEKVNQSAWGLLKVPSSAPRRQAHHANIGPSD